MSKCRTAWFFTPRILRSHKSDCWGDELTSALAAYTDEWLRGLAHAGYDAIWVRLDLRATVPSRLFPRVGPKCLDSLNRLVERAARHGVRVVVYLNEPKALRADDPFWKKHADLQGLPGSVPGALPRLGGDFIRLCTSQPAVREFLEESAAALFKKTPGLGGAFLINASETFTHCYSHYYPKPGPKCPAFKVNWRTHMPPDIFEQAAGMGEAHMDAWRRGMTCPRCASRTPVEVAAEVIAALARGIHASAPRAPVIVWTWSWMVIEPDPQPELIRRLPKDVILMSDWERGGVKNIVGRPYYVDEYSFSCLGPSPRFLAQCRLARARGLKVMAKMMVGATHEFAAVPYLPLQSLLAEKMIRLRRLGINGFLGCWNFGGDLNPMSRLAGRLSRAPALTAEQSLRWLARSEFGARRPAALLAAWRYFGRAWREYPFSTPLIYNGPMNYAPAFPFGLRSSDTPIPPNYHALPRDRNGHILAGYNPERWINPGIMGERYQRFCSHTPAPFDADTVMAALKRLLAHWRRGLADYRTALARNGNPELMLREYRLAQHIGLCLQSTLHIIEFHALPVTDAGLARSPADARRLRIAEAEYVLVTADRTLIAQDPELGYHPEAHARLYTEADLDFKLEKLKRIIKTLRGRISRHAVKNKDSDND